MQLFVLRRVRANGVLHSDRPRIAAFVCAVGLFVGCSGEPEEAVRYLHDRSFRRATLEQSLQTRDVEYARVRLERYAASETGGWDALPEWNPRTELVSAGELDVDGGVRLGAQLRSRSSYVSIVARARDGDLDALRLLGALAFRLYPVQLLPRTMLALASRDNAARYGLWVDDLEGVNGIVRAEMADGSTLGALSCAGCHASRGATGRIEFGRPNVDFDFGRVLADGAEHPDDPAITRALAWGAGRLDVSTSDGREPVRIPDLRSVRWLTHLQASGLVAQTGLAALAIRIETLIVTSHHEVLRPPREIALGLAVYVWSLADSLPAATGRAGAEGRGESIFQSHCTSCHAGPGMSGPPIAADVIGTDRATSQSPSRGTGMYRVPSLRGVGTRGPLLHDGTVPDLEALFDRARTLDGYPRALHGVRSIPGHTAGLDLTASDRRDLLLYLSGL